MLAVSHNIQWGCGRDGVVDLASVARIVADADIIARCKRSSGTGSPNTAMRLLLWSSLLPHHHWSYIASVDFDGSKVAADGKVTNQRRQWADDPVSLADRFSSRSLSKFPAYKQINDQSVVPRPWSSFPTITSASTTRISNT